MKRLSYLVVILLLASNMYAQTLDDVGRMSINVQRPNNRTIPTEALDILEDRMHQIITTSGISDNAFNKRFALTVTVSVMKKDIIAGSPARVSQTLELVFYVKDIIDGKEYGNSSISTVGVGLNENKSFIMAFNNVKPSNPRLQKMIEDSKQLIVAYYRTNIDKIIADAYTLVQQEQFDEALYVIAQVPDVCTDCTDKCRKATVDIYQKKIDAQGMHLLQEARAAWASSPNADGATKAAQALAQIDLLASCQPEVEALMLEMKEKVKDDERKAWEFELQQYADAKAREQRDFEFRVRQYEEREAKDQARYEDEKAREQRDFEFQQHKYNKDYERDMAIIEASRQVALEYAKNSTHY